MQSVSCNVESWNELFSLLNENRGGFSFFKTLQPVEHQCYSLKCCIYFSYIQQAVPSTTECSLLSNKTNNLLMFSCVSSHPQYIWNGKGTGAKMCPVIICRIITGDAPISCWPIFLSLPSNSPRSQFKRWIALSTG